MKFHIEIKDNETGELIREVNADAVLAATYTEKGVSTTNLVDCNGDVYAGTTAGLMNLLETIKEEDPEEYLFAEFIHAQSKLKVKENDQNE